MKLDLTPLQKACTSLSEAIINACDKSFMNTLNEPQRKLVVAGVIQNFKLTYELCWKFMKRWLNENVGSTYVDGVTRRELFRLAAKNRLINDVDEWMIYHTARNQTSRSYDEETAQEIFETSKKFTHFAKHLLMALETRND